jgi:hypothetical protein
MFVIDRITVYYEARSGVSNTLKSSSVVPFLCGNYVTFWNYNVSKTRPIIMKFVNN